MGEVLLSKLIRGRESKLLIKAAKVVVDSKPSLLLVQPFSLFLESCSYNGKIYCCFFLWHILCLTFGSPVRCGLIEVFWRQNCLFSVPLSRGHLGLDKNLLLIFFKLLALASSSLCCCELVCLLLSLLVCGTLRLLVRSAWILR